GRGLPARAAAAAAHRRPGRAAAGRPSGLTARATGAHRASRRELTHPPLDPRLSHGSQSLLPSQPGGRRKRRVEPSQRATRLPVRARRSTDEGSPQVTSPAARLNTRRWLRRVTAAVTATTAGSVLLLGSPVPTASLIGARDRDGADT